MGARCVFALFVMFSAEFHRIGPLDVLKITVWDGEEFQVAEVAVAEDGTILVPFAINKVMPIRGLSAPELREILVQELKRYYRDPVVQVLVTDYRSHKACMLGEVRGGKGKDEGPGCYSLRGPTRIVEFIAEHGGLAPSADLTAVQVRKAAGKIVTVNLAEALFRGDLTQDVALDPGDVIWVPRRDLDRAAYYVFGEVRKPGLVLAEEGISIVELISRAGSFSSDAARDEVVIVRETAGSAEVMRIDLQKFLEQGDLSQKVGLKSGDIVFVPRRFGAKFRELTRTLLPILGLARDTAILHEVLKEP